jgi:rhamnogalacturonyl hydrolase YesR
MSVKDIYHSVVDQRVRDSVWALRTRRDTSVLSGVVRGVFGVPHTVADTRTHIAATVDWLCAAQDATGNGGVSAFYDVRAGTWGPPYPETTGYIIPTFYDVAAWNGDDEYRQRAVRMADWLLGLQLEGGAFPIGPLWPDWDRAPLVFDTGQIIHGLVRAFEETKRSQYADSAIRASRWLAEIQEGDGSWRRFSAPGSDHTYNVRSSFGLVRLYKATGDERSKRTAQRNLEWALSQQTADGWFTNMEFRANEDPLTHTIAYTIEGILESGVILEDQSLIDSARRAADVMIKLQNAHGYLRGRYGRGWRESAPWSCLTGTAQMAMIWYHLYEMTGVADYFQAAQAANHHVKQRQCRGSSIPGVRGGIAGSWPIYCEYEPYRNLNWAAKFFVDGLLREDRLQARSDSHASSLRQ